jgi:lipopolysaccharide export system permease protein
MTLLQRYFQKQAVWPMVLSLSALTGLAVLTQSLQTLDLIVENRQTGFAFIKIIGLAMPQLIAIILPLSAFIATLYAFNRLNTDSELIVAKAAGFSPWQISRPALRLGVILCLIHLFINLVVQPYAFRQMRAEILEIRTDIVSQLVQQGEFVTPFDGLTAYAREIGVDNTLQDVMIFDTRDEDNKITLTAKTGTIQSQNGTVVLTLRYGAVQKLLEAGELDVVEFSDYVLDLSDMIEDRGGLFLKPSDRYLNELFNPPDKDSLSPEFQKELKAEGHARLSAPLYNIALIGLALVFLVRGEHQRMGYSRRIMVCGLLGFVIRLSGFGVTSAAETDPFLNPLQYAVPLFVIVFCLAYLLKPKRVRRMGSSARARHYAHMLLTSAES